MSDPNHADDTARVSSRQQDLLGYELLVAVTGGIAAYKTCHVVSRTVQRGCGVTVAMTESATRFVGPVTFRALSGRRVFTSMWEADDRYDHQHVQLTERADLFLIAPATANIVGKIAGGIGDDLVSTMALSVDSPLVLAPAMNARMWSNAVVQQNVEKLRSLGVQLVGPDAGWLSCRETGMGRMAEPVQIIDAVARLLLERPPKAQSLA